MCRPQINEGRLILIVVAKLLMLSTAAACNRRTIIRSGVTEYDKHIIINMHNRVRQTVALGHISSQPPAANMMEMKWDDQLAAKAQLWANCGADYHDKTRHNSKFLVGQNMASSWTTRSPPNYYDTDPNFVSDAILRWFNEEKHFNYGRFSAGATGHYTQVVWAESKAVGCGYAYYFNPSKGFTKNYVCNYGPSGNVLDELPYVKGYPNCHRYGLVDSKSYEGLCDEPISPNNLFNFLHYVRFK